MQRCSRDFRLQVCGTEVTSILWSEDDAGALRLVAGRCGGGFDFDVQLCFLRITISPTRLRTEI
jgi:hypothetical protein